MKKAVLVILDGWGLAANGPGNAISLANTPIMGRLVKECSHTTLLTSGEDVGLPHGQMGNSEVGHLNIGAGRIVWQELANINKSIREKTFDTQPVLVNAFEEAKKKNCKLHFIGLVSNGGVHSHINHLKQLCTLADDHGLEKVFIHAFTDGRDTDPKSGIHFLNELQDHLDNATGKIASVTGRYYAMDRDNRWERVKVAYDALTVGIGEKNTSWKNALENSYAANITDEFIKPIIISNAANNPIGNIDPNDIVICFNFRTDRCREITIALTQKDMPEHGMHTLPLHYVTMTRYDNTYKGVDVVYEKNNLSLTIGEVLENAGKKQIRIAETEKYPHVTFFFSGGREAPFKGETRLMAPSPKVATYDLQPEMSAEEIKNLIIPELKKGEVDFVCLNFANADMVGHTGVYSAIIKAVETADHCLEKLVTALKPLGYQLIVIADHGNADFAINDDGTPNTAHTTNPVPVWFITDNKSLKISDGILADVAPSILNLMGISVPAEMTGKNLIA